MAVVGCYCATQLKPSPFIGHFPVLLGKTLSQQNVQSSVCRSRVNALFWGAKKTVEPPDLCIPLGDFFLTGLGSEGASTSSCTPKKISLLALSSISEVSSKDWDACVRDASGHGKFNPFLTHDFLSSLEESGCSVKEKGWLPRHIIAKDETNKILGVVPLYLKSHSYGEYTFDHSWADAYYSCGSSYYPKLQCCVPFTPVTGQRILICDTPYKDEVFDVLVSALRDLSTKLQVSSLHITFPSQHEWCLLEEKGFLQRLGMQYHWKNRSYRKFQQIVNSHPLFFKSDTCIGNNIPLNVSAFHSFDEFLMDLKQNKRKNIRQERKKISVQNLTMKRLRGYEIKANHWDTFYKFYRNTTDNKWGHAYLTRDFFHIMGSKMGDNVLLVIAKDGDEMVAGALNLIGGDTLYGRLWGCLPESYYPSLHFEACYYQAIEAAIEFNLDKVEAGAQGEHKIQRGYLPVTTYSCHYILDEGFRKAIADFLVRETAQVRLVMKLLHDSSPFKDEIQWDNNGT